MSAGPPLPNPSPSPWSDERVVVVSDDPWSVEAAVTQLEAWGAQPAVMFERTRALRALSVAEPDLVVLDFGRDPAAVGTLLGGLEEVAPVLPGALHGAPVVALAEGPIAPRLERDAWAPLHVVPHDDPGAVREALLAALAEATSVVGAETSPSVPAVPTGGPVGATEAAAPVGRRSLGPLAAAGAVAFAAAGMATAIFLRERARRAETGVAQPGGPAATGAAPSVTRAAAPTAGPTAAATGVPAGVPTTAAAPAVPTGAPASGPTTAATTALAPTTAAPTLAPTAPPTAAPPTVAPPTVAPPTVAPPTVVPPTVAPAIAVPGTATAAAATAGAGVAGEGAAATPGRLPVTGSR